MCARVSFCSTDALYVGNWRKFRRTARFGASWPAFLALWRAIFKVGNVFPASGNAIQSLGIAFPSLGIAFPKAGIALPKLEHKKPVAGLLNFMSEPATGCLWPKLLLVYGSASTLMKKR